VRALNVLIVDDYQDTAETTAMTLPLCRDTVTTANDGESALQAVTASWPDVVLLDLGLPGMSGYEVAKRIRAMTGSRQEPLIIAVTGHVAQAGLYETDGFDD
jgi:two-component system CheB/CheR fusion protein